jgi:inhibitor of KinA sporulation pathway (predicted exonuclease)
VTLERTGTHHHALDDARYQALHLMKILNEELSDSRPL